MIISNDVFTELLNLCSTPKYQIEQNNMPCVSQREQNNRFLKHNFPDFRLGFWFLLRVLQIIFTYFFVLEGS